MEWLPIETAPKDDTQILLYGICSGEIYGVRDCYDTVVGAYSMGEFRLTEGDCYTVVVIATHWMSLPPPPVNHAKV